MLSVVPPHARRVLVVEDDHDTRVSLRESLEDEGFVVLSATNGRDAVAILRHAQLPNLILLDQMLPLMNGEEFLRWKSGDECVSQIPVVVISAYKNRIALGNGLDFIAKPLDRDRLIDLVRSKCAA